MCTYNIWKRKLVKLSRPVKIQRHNKYQNCISENKLTRITSSNKKSNLAKIDLLKAVHIGLAYNLFV